jgi:signal transduction histidine kinase
LTYYPSQSICDRPVFGLGGQISGFAALENLNSSIQTVLVFILRLAVLRNLRYVLIIAGTDAKRHWSGEAVQVSFVFRILVIGFAVLMVEVRPVDAQEPTRRVLLLYPYDNVNPATVTAGTAIRKRLSEQSVLKIDIHSDFLDLTRFPAEADQLRSAHYLAEKYAANPPEIIMPLGPEAQRFAIKYRGIIAPNVPIVFCCTTPELAAAADRPADVTGIYGEFDAGKTIALAQKLQPMARKLIVISGSSEMDRQWLDSVRKQIEPYEAQLNTEYWVGLSYETLLDRASRLPPDTIVLFMTVYRDGSGRPSVPVEVLSDLTRVAGAPVYGPSDNYLGRGIVGGYTDSYELMGAGAAGMALEILAGKNPATIAPRPSENRTYKVDARQLLRWKMSEANLPKGTAVYFREPTIWQEHRNLVLAAIFVVLLQAILISALSIQVFRRRGAEATSRTTLSDLARVTRLTTIGEMTASIAHEISQPLGAIVTNGEAGLRWLANATPDLDEVRAALTRIVGNGHRASDVIGRIRAMLKKDVGERVLLDFNELVEEVLIFVRGEIDDHSVVLQTQLQRDLPKIFADRIQLQQVVLNLVLNGIDAMTSVSDHERQLKLRSERGDHSTVMFSVEDAGKGIGTDIKDRIFEAFFTTKSHGMGMGLSICRSIISSHGGRLLVLAGHPYGTVFQVELPVHRSGAV